MQRVVQATYRAWLPIIPISARPPLDDKGKVYISFHIMPDGSVRSMSLDGPSGETALDRAAWAGITNAGYPPLPPEYKGKDLWLRFGFYYNIDPSMEK
jgi:TonB family protein